MTIPAAAAQRPVEEFAGYNVPEAGGQGLSTFERLRIPLLVDDVAQIVAVVAIHHVPKGRKRYKE